MTRSESLPTICPFCESQDVYTWTYQPAALDFAVTRRYIKCRDCGEKHDYEI